MCLDRYLLIRLADGYSPRNWAAHHHTFDYGLSPYRRFLGHAYGQGDLRGGLREGALAVLPFETLYTAPGVNQLLLAGIEGMALTAELDFELLFGGPGRKRVSTGTLDRSLYVFWVDSLLHISRLARASNGPGGRLRRERSQIAPSPLVHSLGSRYLSQELRVALGGAHLVDEHFQTGDVFESMKNAAKLPD